MIKDGDFQLIEWDAKLGRSVWAYFDGEKTVVRTDYLVDQTLANNQLSRSEFGKMGTGDWNRVASIPPNVYYDQLHAAEVQGDEKFVTRWLNDSDHRAWRTTEGSV
jgi:hypothetical protein